MSTRTTFHNSIIPLPDGPGLTPHGLEVDLARPEDNDQVMHLFFSLSMPAGRQADLEHKIAKGEVVSPAELKTTYIADPKDTATLISWLTGQGFLDISASPNGTGVYASGTAAQVASSLQVGMVRVTRDGKTYTAAKDAPSLPSEVAGSVQAIVGLQPYRQFNKHRLVPARIALTDPTVTSPDASSPATTIPGPPPFLVSNLLGIYDANNPGVTGANQIIAILIDTFPTDNDLQAFWTLNGLNITSQQIQKINVPGGPPLPTPSGEETLDAEWASGIAPGATIRIYAAGSLKWVDIDRALDAILNDLGNFPNMRQLSISFGLGETYMPGGKYGEAASQAQKYLRLAAAGVNVFVSSGDGGSNPSLNGHTPNGITQVEYPSSDPSVIGVGGTNLVLAPDGSLVSETGWPAGGGGISSFFDRPGWQTGNGITNGALRLVPDVSLAANVNNGATIILNGLQKGVSGTSWSTPVWAGFCALINEARARAGKPLLPALNPQLYPLLGSPSFRDIQSGSNGAYTAGQGYDMVTGIGVPDLQQLTTALTTPPAASPPPGPSTT